MYFTLTQVSTQVELKERTMFYLYSTGILTSCFGVATRESRNIIWIYLVQKTSRTIHIFCSILVIFFHLRHIFQTSSFKFLNVCRILYNLIITYLILFTESHTSSQLDSHINALLTNITEKGKKKIRLSDFCLTMIDLTICIIQLSLFFSYEIKHGVKTGYIILMGKGSSPNYPIYYLGLINFFYLICAVIGACHYYILVQYIIYIYAKQVYTELIINKPYIRCGCFTISSVRSKWKGKMSCQSCQDEMAQTSIENQSMTIYQPHIQTVIRLELIFLNKLRRQINESIGINAFGLMVPLWSFFVFGVANFIAHGQLFSTYFTIITTIVSNCYTWTYALILISATNRSTSVINSIRNFAKSLILYMDSYGFMDHQLKQYLLLEPIEPLKMWDFIEIRSSLLLRVMNSVIPITAMISTSMQSYF